MYDCSLPFGASRSCRICQALSDVIVRLMNKVGFCCVSYIDDFLVIGKSMTECQSALDYLLELVQSLGFEVNWWKVASPNQVTTFLGVEINCIERTLSLPPEKLAETRLLIKSWLTKKKCTKKELQRLVGKLNWCSRVVSGGRTFMRNLINMIVRLKKQNHHIRLSSAAKADLKWWSTGLDLFHGTTPFSCDLALPSYQFSTDACWLVVVPILQEIGFMCHG
jgi:hypothetical protein